MPSEKQEDVAVHGSKELSRRKFLFCVGRAAATSCLPLSGAPILLADVNPLLAGEFRNLVIESSTPPPVIVENSGYRLLIDSEKGSIVSFRSTFGIDRELLLSDHVSLPLLRIELMNDHFQFRTVTSADAKKIEVTRSGEVKDQQVTVDFKGMGEPSVDAYVTIRCPSDETLTYWSLELRNNTEWWIANIQFPVIEVPFDPPAEEPNHILCSFGDGALFGPVEPSMSVGVWGSKGRNNAEALRFNNYPGQWTSAQLMAYYNANGGLYVACDDPTGLPKFIAPLLEDDGVTMALGHYPGTRGPGTTKLPYSVVLGTFHGDWYRAAEIYREWSSQQPFCAHKLSDRKDCPRWITEPVVGITFPMRGQGDWDPPAAVNSEYTPATNALPYLEKLAAELKSPLMPIIFNWEHGGPWVQPDAFPPVGGEAPMQEFMTKAKDKGWHPVLYGDGLCWVTWQRNTKYDGMPYFHSHGGADAVIRKWDGTLLEWDFIEWRKNYLACVGTELGRRMILEMTRKMAELGPDVVQQFDQGPGPVACYATNHGHPPVPGPWMTEAFRNLLQEDYEIAREKNPRVAMSCEGAPPETHLQSFQIWDARSFGCPLYSFLYHEYGNGHESFYTNRVDDAALRLSVAKSIVTGYIVNFTLRDKGQIEFDWDQLWTRAIPDQAGILDWAQRATEFRGVVARNYLVFGRMLRPWHVTNVAHRDFGRGMEPLIQSATWQAQNGSIGLVLANSADLAQSPRVELDGNGNCQLSLYMDGERKERRIDLPAVVDLEMAPRSFCLIELTEASS